MKRSTFIIFTALVFILPAIASAQNAEVKASSPAIARIAFLGDSITAGVGVKDKTKERYATVTTRLLASTYPGITEINLGQSSRALCQQNSSYAESVLKQNPDAVVIQWGVNDQYWGFSVSEFTSRYDALVAALRTAKPLIPIVVTTLIADFRRAENQDVWIGEANIALQEIAVRYHCHLADTHRAFDHRKELYADSIHPNTEGAEVMAKTIVAAIEAQPQSVENAAVSFDQGTEVRFLQNVFMPKREGIKPEWVHVTNISSKGMTIESNISVAIRTAPIYAKGSYHIGIQDKDGAVVDTVVCTADFSRTHSFVFDPKGHDGPFRIDIAPEKSTAKQSSNSGE
jgi:lysophospholipase L1-like esterase